MPKPLCSRAKELVASLIEYFEKEKEANGPLVPFAAVRERVAAALNLSINTVSSISQAVKNNEALRSPRKKRLRPKTVTNTDNVDSSAVRNTIYEMYENKQNVTLMTLHQKLKDKELFNGCPKSLRILIGFVEGPDLVFASKTQKGDYHGKMNQENFLKWFEQQLLPNLQQPSAIIMDNAPYHNTLITKTPNTSWTKSSIQEWLTSQGINFSPAFLKTELLNLVAQNKPPKVYRIDQMAEQHGHRVLRLPPYHCQFNAIELVWGICKNYYNSRIGRDGRSISASLNMWQEALGSVTGETWKRSIAHAEKKIMMWYEKKQVMDREEANPSIIHVDDESSDSEELFDSDEQ